MSIVLDGVTKVYAGRRVVDRVSLEVGDGELFVLLGSSGSGKSTVLRLIAGLSGVDAGTVTLFGRDVTDLPPQARGVGFVFQNYSIFRHMTVARNIEFGLRLRGVSRSERRRKSGELLELIGLGGLGGRYANQLSGGQQQRVALARALAYEPRVLLLDEPFGALDAKIRLQLRRTLREIQQALQVTTILVTHDQDEAFELADRIGVVDRGRLLEVGTSEELYTRPESFFVATFLGAGVVLHGRCEEGRARFGALTLPIPDDLPHEEGGPVRVLIRPEQILLEPLPHGDAPAAPNAAPVPTLGPGTVVEEIFAGSSRRVRVRIPEQAGLRQIFPLAPFGETGILIDAVVPADRTIPDEVSVELKGWRVLAQPEPRILAAGEAPETAAAAAKLARAIGAAVTVLGVAKDPDRVDRTRAQIKDRLGDDAAGAEIRVRSGERIEQVLSELSESFYDLVVTDGGGEERRRMAGEQTLLRRSRTPILFARNAGRPIRSLLICTAVGEPGRNDVRFGGWFAARLKARVLLLHVAARGETPPAWVRAHLDRGVRTLKALGVEGDFKIVPAKTPLEGILAEAKTGDHDLVVIGRHAGRARSVRGKDDVTFQVLRSTDRPVLVVPADG
jgi:ABC-type Fe3+/spermidine/putrescine transport system ATPase subunit/nucleotide-binding universal stress UspA family protein